MTDAAALDALGDPTRRAIIECLARQELPVGALADLLPISRPAVSQHLRILKDANLVHETTVGTRHFYRVNPEGLATARDYLDRFWMTALEKFAAITQETQETQETRDNKER